MKAMLCKNFLYLRRQGKLLPVVVITFAVLTAMQASPARSSPAESTVGMVGAFWAMLTVVLTINMLGLDAQAQWNGFARSLPVRVSSIVGAQYVFTAVLSAGGIAVEGITALACGGCRAQDLAVVCAVTFAAPLLICSFLLPIYYKFGYQKSAVVILLAVFLVSGAISFLQTRGLELLSGPQFVLLAKLSPVVLAAVVALSFFLSCRIYARKEV